VVDLEGNSRPIEEIQEGDWVLARSEFDPQGPLELKRVEEKFVRTAAVMELVINGQTIKTTAEHPFYVPAQERFVPAGELQVGDLLVSSQGTLIPIESISQLNEITTVYNLRVADHHTYFVGGALWGWDVWVHNARYVSADEADEVISVFQGSSVAAGRAHNAFRNKQRLLIGATEAHHPFFRMFLRAMDKSGSASAKTSSGRFLSQTLAYLDPASHRLLHSEWDDFVSAKGLGFLQAKLNNGARLAKELSIGTVTPAQIFDNLEEFFMLMARKNMDGAGDAWLSVKSLRKRMGH